MYSGIYLIRNLKNGKCYVGETEGKIKNRVTRHLNGHTPGCRAIHDAITKHGRENFDDEILESNVIPELLPELEKFYIAKFDTFHNGYNLTEGGETGHQSEETIRRRTEKLRANPPMKGKKQTPEACAKMSKSRTGLKRTSETCKRMSESAMGHEVSPETRAKIGDANRGKKRSDEARQAQSERNSGEGNPMYGKKRVNDHLTGKNNPLALPDIAKSREYFFSLPTDMDLKSKKRLLRQKFPDVKRRTMQKRCDRWQRDLA